MSKRHIFPGFGLTVGWTTTYLGLIVLIPFACLIAKTAEGGWEHFFSTVTSPQVVASYRISFGVSLVAALINGVFGVVTAWVLVRYNFPGKRLFDAIVDLPFALPTAVAGIALCSIYSPKEYIGNLFSYESFLGHFFAPGTAIGQWLATQDWAQEYLGRDGLRIAYTPVGILIALTFIGLPFVVRTVQPVIQDLSVELEEAAACLGANRWQTFCRVILPSLTPSILTGVTLAYGRAVGEYGSVVFIAGNQPFRTEITPLLIISKLEQYDFTGAAGIGFVMLLASFVIVLISNLFQSWNNRRKGLA